MTARVEPDVVRDLLRARSVEAAFRAVLDGVERHLPGDGAAAIVATSDGNRCVGRRGTLGPATGPTSDPDPGPGPNPDPGQLAHEVIRSGQACRIDDVGATRSTSTASSPPDASAHRYRSFLGAPVGDRGVVFAVSASPGSFSTSDEAWLVELAGHAAAALDGLQPAKTDGGDHPGSTPPDLRSPQDSLDSAPSTTVLWTVLEHLPIGVVVEDASRTILAANPTLLEVFGTAGDVVDLLGRDCGALAEEMRHLVAEPDAFVDRIDELVDRREPVRDEVVEVADGRLLERSYIPYALDDGAANLWLYRDVTERRTRERALEERNERLDAFASMVSHDLKNPLNVASGRVTLAYEETGNEHLETAMDAHDRMQRLIEQLLTMVRDDASPRQLESVDLRDVVASCWENVGTSAATLELDVTGRIRADRSLCRQLVENLLVNAVEHAGPGVSVEVGVLPDGFYVADDGPGIPIEDRGRIFESGYSTSEDGTGLGLRIVAELATAHDWEVDVTEADLGGARFEVTGVEFVDG